MPRCRVLFHASFRQPGRWLFKLDKVVKEAFQSEEHWLHKVFCPCDNSLRKNGKNDFDRRRPLWTNRCYDKERPWEASGPRAGEQNSVARRHTAQCTGMPPIRQNAVEKPFCPREGFGQSRRNPLLRNAAGEDNGLRRRAEAVGPPAPPPTRRPNT